MTGDESPSRMRTRNKPAKESNNKRPKRGGDAPDASATNENTKTPNKTDRRKSSKETPTKGKKRTNIDLDADNDGSDEKEKRKRTESPTESLNSDSRPGSVLDEQENTNEPPDTPMADADRKESDSKAASEASPIDETTGNATPKDDKTNASSTSTAIKSESTIDKDKDSSNEKPRSVSGDDSSNSVDEKSDATAASTAAKANDSPAPVSKANNTTSSTVTNANAITSTAQTVPSLAATSTIANSSIASAGDIKPIEKIEGPQDGSFAPKEQEIISTVANIKKESGASMAVENSNENAAAKKVSMVIKKEPGDDSAENSSSSNSNSNSNSGVSGKDANVEPSHDIKLASDIKTESKCGLDLSDSNSKHEDGSRSAFEPHIKFNTAIKLPPEPHAKFNSEPLKPHEPMKFGPDAALAAKYSPMAADLSQKYEPKLFSDPSNKLIDSDTKEKVISDGK